MSGSAKERASSIHAKGYSCSGAVLAAFADELGMSDRQAVRTAAPMAGGAKIKCGAVLAAEYVLDKKANEQGNSSADFISEFEKRFKEENTSVICRELRGGLGAPRLRSCRGCVEDSADILEQMLKEL